MSLYVLFKTQCLSLQRILSCPITNIEIREMSGTTQDVRRLYKMSDVRCQDARLHYQHTYRIRNTQSPNLQPVVEARYIFSCHMFSHAMLWTPCISYPHVDQLCPLAFRVSSSTTVFFAKSNEYFLLKSASGVPFLKVQVILPKTFCFPAFR